MGPIKSLSEISKLSFEAYYGDENQRATQEQFNPFRAENWSCLSCIRLSARPNKSLNWYARNAV